MVMGTLVLHPPRFARHFWQRLPVGAWLRWLILALAVLGCLGVPWSARCSAQEVTVSAAVEPAAVSLGESVEFSISIQGAQEPDQPPAISVEGAQVQYVGPSKQASLINFQLSVSMAHRYLLTPSRVGELTIPAVALEIRGKRYETQPVTLKVTAAPQEDGRQPSVPGPFVECEIPRRPVYVGESFPVQVRLLVPSETPWRIERLPQFETDAFTKAPFQQPQQQQQVRDGRSFDALLFPTALTAIKSGEVPLGPIQFKIQQAVPQKKQPNARGPFGGIFNGFPFVNQQATFQEKTVVLPEHRMAVSELPEMGKPASFRGAIGQFQFHAAFNQNRVKVGEPLVATLTIEGQGNFDRIEPPPILAPEGWRIYPPEIHFTKADEFGLRGTKTFRIAVVPQNAQSQMPEFEFASFNPDAASYQIQKSQSAPLSVEGSLDKAQLEAIESASLPSKKRERPLEKAAAAQPGGIPLLEVNKPSVAASPVWANRPLFWSVQGVLLAALFAAALWKWNVRRVLALGPAPHLRQEASKIEQGLALQTSRSDWFNQAKRVVQLRTAAHSGQPAEAVDLPDALAVLAHASKVAEDVRWLFETDAALRFGGQTLEIPPKPEEQRRIQALLRHLS